MITNKHILFSIYTACNKFYILHKQRPYYPNYSVILHLRGRSLIPCAKEPQDKWVYGHTVPSVHWLSADSTWCMWWHFEVQCRKKIKIKLTMAIATMATLLPVPGLAHLQLALCNVYHKYVLVSYRGSAQSRKQTH